MPVVRSSANGSENCDALLIGHTAYRRLGTDLPHLALSLDRGAAHERLNAKLAQRLIDLFHFGGAPFAVLRHALEVVGNNF